MLFVTGSHVELSSFCFFESTVCETWVRDRAAEQTAVLPCLEGLLHDPNPSTRLIKWTIIKEIFGWKISRPRLISIRWNFVCGKGTRFKDIFWVTNPEKPRYSMHSYSFLNYSRSKSPDDAGMHSYSFLIEFQEPISFF